MRTFKEWLDDNPNYKPVRHELMENVYRKQYDSFNLWAQECIDDKMKEIDLLLSKANLGA